MIPAAMEAKLVAELPTGPGWRFEPKWDGFRALVLRDGAQIEIQSKSGKPLARYFPEIVAMIAAVSEQHVLLDGELILPVGDVLSFDALQQRLHPAESRIARLARETPAQLMLFDLLAEGGRPLAHQPFAERRQALEAFHARHGSPALLLSPQTEELTQAEAWLRASGGALDGVVAKQADLPYRPGERAMLKVKQHRTADCVVGGVRRSADGAIASLLLGLYGSDGLLHHVGFVGGLPAAERRALSDRIAPHLGGPGFTGKAPGGPSRWTGGGGACL
jgi:ATP-dependent DNA ligase